MFKYQTPDNSCDTRASRRDINIFLSTDYHPALVLTIQSAELLFKTMAPISFRSFHEKYFDQTGDISCSAYFFAKCTLHPQDRRIQRFCSFLVLHWTHHQGRQSLDNSPWPKYNAQDSQQTSQEPNTESTLLPSFVELQKKSEPSSHTTESVWDEYCRSRAVTVPPFGPKQVLTGGPTEPASHQQSSTGCP